MIASLLAMTLALSSGDAPASPSNAAAGSAWQTNADGAALPLAHIALPRRAGTLSLTGTGEGTHRGEHIDNVAQFESPDRQVFATVFVFTPSQPDPRLIAIGTHNAIRLQSGSGLETGPSRQVAAGGVAGTAILRSYGHFRGTLASIVAVIKSGRWIVAVRVSGPDDRRAEVEAAATALLDGMRFDEAAKPQISPATDLAACGTEVQSRDARLLPPLPLEHLLLMVAMVNMGSAVSEGDDSHAPPRVPSRAADTLCLASRLHIGNQTAPLIHQSDAQGNRVAVYAILDDAGGLFEVSAFNSPLGNAHAFQLYHRAIGRTEILGNFDRLPSDAQLAEIVADPNHRARRLIAAATTDVDGHTNVEISADAIPHR